MNCFLHLHTELEPHTEKLPKFARSDDYHDAGQRTVLRCPVAGCHVVAIFNDVDRVDERKCRCGRKLTHDSLSEKRCWRCAQGRNARRRAERRNRNHAQASATKAVKR